MIIKQKGKYRLLEGLISRGSVSVTIFEKGSIINVTQIDNKNKNIYIEEVGDWHRQDINNVELVE